MQAYKSWWFPPLPLPLQRSSSKLPSTRASHNEHFTQVPQSARSAKDDNTIVASSWLMLFLLLLLLLLLALVTATACCLLSCFYNLPQWGREQQPQQRQPQQLELCQRKQNNPKKWVEKAVTEQRNWKHTKNVQDKLPSQLERTRPGRAGPKIMPKDNMQHSK